MKLKDIIKVLEESSHETININGGLCWIYNTGDMGEDELDMETLIKVLKYSLDDKEQ